jgi:integrase
MRRTLGRAGWPAWPRLPDRPAGASEDAGPRRLPDHRTGATLPPAGGGAPTDATKRLNRRGAGRTLHQLRHSDLTHEAEGGASTPMLPARSRHASVRSLERYARPSVDAGVDMRHVAQVVWGSQNVQLQDGGTTRARRCRLPEPSGRL